MLFDCFVLMIDYSFKSLSESYLEMSHFNDAQNIGTCLLQEEQEDNFTKIIRETKNYFNVNDDLNDIKNNKKAHKNYKSIIKELTEKRYRPT